MKFWSLYLEFFLQVYWLRLGLIPRSQYIFPTFKVIFIIAFSPDYAIIPPSHMKLDI